VKESYWRDKNTINTEGQLGLISVKIIFISSDMPSLILWVQTSRMVTCGIFLTKNYLEVKLPYKYSTHLNKAKIEIHLLLVAENT
jgi:hypothetical protein